MALQRLVLFLKTFYSLVLVVVRLCQYILSLFCILRVHCCSGGATKLGPHEAELKMNDLTVPF